MVNCCMIKASTVCANVKAMVGNLVLVMVFIPFLNTCTLLLILKLFLVLYSEVH